MNEITGALFGIGIIIIGFIVIPLMYSKSGGYSELAKAFKAKRPINASATYQTISVEKGYGFLGAFTGVNFYFDKNGFYIYPMFRVWSLFMPTLFLPYNEIRVERVRYLGVFKKLKVTFNKKTLPSLYIPNKFYSKIKSNVQNI